MWSAAFEGLAASDDAGRTAPGGLRRGRRPWSPRLGLDRLHVRLGGTLGALLGVVAHLPALSQRLEAAALDRGVMHEQVFAGVIGRDEAEALVVVEPLHGSCCHLDSLPGMCTADRGGCC